VDEDGEDDEDAADDAADEDEDDAAEDAADEDDEDDAEDAEDDEAADDADEDAEAEDRRRRSGHYYDRFAIAKRRMRWLPGCVASARFAGSRIRPSCPEERRSSMTRRAVLLLLACVGVLGAVAAPVPVGDLVAWFDAFAEAAVRRNEYGVVSLAYFAADPLSNETQLTTQAHGGCYTVDGHANPQLSPTAATTLFRIGSVSKLVTATALFQLVEQGRLALNDSLADVLPEPLASRVAARAASPPWQVADLLRHTLPVDELTLRLEVAGAGAPVSMVDVATNLWTAFVPDLVDDVPAGAAATPLRRISYSNLAVAIEGAVVEHVSGQRFGDYIREHINGPLGVQVFLSHDELHGDYSHVCYGPTSAAYEPFQVLPTASGDLYASTTGVALFLARHAAGGVGLFNSSATAALMHSILYPGAAVLPGVFHGMAHQFVASVRHGTRVLSHDGSVFSFACQAVLYPDYFDGLFLATTPGRAAAAGDSPYLPTEVLDSFTATFHNAQGTPDEVPTRLPWLNDTAAQAILPALAGEFIATRRTHLGITALGYLFSPITVDVVALPDEEDATAMVHGIAFTYRGGDAVHYRLTEVSTVPPNVVVLQSVLVPPRNETRFLVATFAGAAAGGASALLQIEVISDTVTAVPVTAATDGRVNLGLLIPEALLLVLTLVLWGIVPAFRAFATFIRVRRGLQVDAEGSPLLDGRARSLDSPKDPLLAPASPTLQGSRGSDGASVQLWTGEATVFGRLLRVAKGGAAVAALGAIPSWLAAVLLPAPAAYFGLNPAFPAVATFLLLSTVCVLLACAIVFVSALVDARRRRAGEAHGSLRWWPVVGTGEVLLAALLVAMQTCALVAFVHVNLIAFRFW